jgi:CAAX protease family protein
LHLRGRRRTGGSFGRFVASDTVVRGGASVTWGRIQAGGGPALLLMAALVPSLRPAVAVIVIAGWIVLRLRDVRAAVAWAAVLPVAVLLTAPWILGGDAPMGEAACQDPLSVIALRRVAAAAVVLGLIGILAIAHRGGADELGLGRPSATAVAGAVGGCLVLAAGGLYLGPWIARPFFGELSYPVPVGALVPAIVFGAANGVLEEVGYRGAMQAWLARVSPVGVAIAFQGLIFGIVHAGPEVQALLPVHVGLLALVGIAAGLIRRRTGSLAVPIGIHIGADIALYVGLACRAAT